MDECRDVEDRILREIVDGTTLKTAGGCAHEVDQDTEATCAWLMAWSDPEMVGRTLLSANINFLATVPAGVAPWPHFRQALEERGLHHIVEMMERAGVR